MAALLEQGQAHAGGGSSDDLTLLVARARQGRGYGASSSPAATEHSDEALNQSGSSTVSELSRAREETRNAGHRGRVDGGRGRANAGRIGVRGRVPLRTPPLPLPQSAAYPFDSIAVHGVRRGGPHANGGS